MEVRPFESVGAILLGSSRLAAQEAVGTAPYTFKKHAAERPIEVFEQAGLHLHFDASDRLEFIEAFDPAIVSLEGIHMLGRPIKDVTRDLVAKGIKCNVISGSVRCDTVGISLFAPSGNVESVGIYRQGYFEE
jgi:hypothetical protein